MAATFTHDLRGLLATRTLENGASSTYTYEAAARLRAMRGTVPVTYSLNAVGQRTGRHDAAFGPESYAYDAIDQVIGANYGGVRSEGFAYDAMGNRQSASDTAAGITAYTVRADNAYTSVGGISTQTDLNGNMVASPLKTENGTLKTGIYAYDAQNRLTSATVNGATTEFTYDSRNRVVRRVSGNGTLNLTYSGWNLIEERNASGALEQVYVHGAGIDEILVKITAAGPAYYHHDGLGSTIALTGENGALLESYRYDAFGAVSVFNSSFILQTSSLVSNRFLFTGRDHRRLGSLGGDCRRQPVGRDEQERASQLLAEIGLYDYRNRVYSAELGRFLQTDPIRFSAGDVNLYRYVSNNAVNWVDPLGLWSKQAKAIWDALGYAVPGSEFPAAAHAAPDLAKILIISAFKKVCESCIFDPPECDPDCSQICGEYEIVKGKLGT